MASPTNQQGTCANRNGSEKNENQDIQNNLLRIRHKLIVMSGKGGVGKSSFSVNLAASMAKKGFHVGLLDVDLHGPSVAGMLGNSQLLDVDPTNKVIPNKYNENLKFVSMQSLMRDGDQAVIWRGPAKTGVIQQFIGSVLWQDLDFLIVDSPPGTGDEPLSVAQTINDAKAIIVTTPQEVALSDVRKSINFCRTVNLELLGLVENMGPFNCPCCGETIELFKKDGGAVTAEKMGITNLGSIPFDPKLVKACDTGRPLADTNESTDFVNALNIVIKNITEKL
ncbi:MAG: Mrp/NBP35 family ATP-binding protein [Desulfobacteraceae bacterium]|jgi:Mrp family chromosome partitioning ATPase